MKFVQPYYEIVVAGPKARQVVKELNRQYLPNTLLVAAEIAQENQLPLLEFRFVEGETKIYVCQNKVCQLPVTTVEDAMKQITPK